MRPLPILSVCLLFHLSFLEAAPRTGGEYTIPAEVVDGGGGASAGGDSYLILSSLGGLGTIVAAESAQQVSRGGYPGQLYEVHSLSVEASPSIINEGADSQLSATVALDDSTLLNPAPTQVHWSLVSGRISNITPSGLITANTVYQNEVATLGGTYAGLFGTGVVSILDSDLDNFEAYGGDGIDDSWQFQYFGPPPNPDAGPGENPDRDADDNEMEFLAGFDPTNPADWFRVVMLGKSGNTATLQLNKVIPGRIYTMKAGTDLITFGETITTFSVGAEETDKVIQDTNATAGKKFYTIDVTRP